MPSRLRQSRCRSSNPSLSGRVAVKRFQTTPSIVSDVHSQGPRFSSGSALGPPMMESGGCGGPICQRVLAVRLTAGIGIRNGLASSIVPAGGHRSAVGGIRVFSCWFPIVHYRTRSPSNHPCCQGCAAPSDTPGHVAAASSLVLHDPDLDLLSYANQSFAFKRETGVTPTQWRKGDDFQ